MSIFRFLIFTIILLGLAFLTHASIYGMQFSLESVSNITFVIGIVFFLPSLVALTGAFQVFHGMGYILKLLFNKNAKQEFPTFSDYKEYKSKKTNVGFFKELIVSSFLIMLTGIIFAIIVFRN
ncbi:MAG: hypothetical protein PHG08_02430 [Bacilli bacterium]|jgi:hypothetical protein|nr:hypothetical protein [Bacilli bacterium]HHU23645.1 hypothetical protein [Acholeplasmataceae bacterium]